MTRPCNGDHCLVYNTFCGVFRYPVTFTVVWYRGSTDPLVKLLKFGLTTSMITIVSDL